MKQKMKLQRLLSFIMAITMVMTTVLTGWIPVAAKEMEVVVDDESAVTSAVKSQVTTTEEISDVTLTVIGDTGNHASDESEHTGYVYWMKDVPLDVDVDQLSDKYVVKNCGEEILAAFAAHKITAAFTDDESLYPGSLAQDEVVLESDSSSNAYWSVIIAYADGTFSSDGWGEYQGAAQLKPGCRLIYYWSDDLTKDCRLTTDDTYNTTLNYDTDAVTAVTMYTENDQDSAASAVSCEAGQTMKLITRLTVPSESNVDRTLTWESSNSAIASVEATQDGALVTAKSVGSAVIRAYMENTLGETIEVSCNVFVTADGTTIIGMSFEEGTELSMEPGDMTVLTTVYAPTLEMDETAPAPVWSSSNPEVASVDVAAGDIEALTPGKAVITASIINNKGQTVTASCTVTVEAVAVKGITLDKTALNMKQSEISEISIRFTPANATEIPEITWESSNPEVATVIAAGEDSGSTYLVNSNGADTVGTNVDGRKAIADNANSTKAIITAMGGGACEITAKVGAYTATCGVVVETADEIVMLKELVFSKDAEAETVYNMQTAIDPITKECTVVVPENTNSFYLKPVLTNGVTATIQAQYRNGADTKDVTKNLPDGVATRLSGSDRLLQSNQDGKEMTLVVTAGTLVQTYTVHVVRESLVKTLVVKDADGVALEYEPEFSDMVRDYELRVMESVDSIDLEFTANRAESTELTVNGETAVDSRYTLQLEGAETVAVIRAGNENVVPAEYTLTVKRMVADSYKFVVSPEDAIVAVYDSKGVRQWGEDNTFAVLPDEIYTYSVTKTGYIAQKGSFSGSGTKNVTLETAPESDYTIFESDWYGLRNNENNQGITVAKTPTTSETVELLWENQYGEGYSSAAVSSQIIVDDKIYCYAADTLMVISKETGEILKSTKMAGRSSFAINPPSYAEGMIFVGLAGGIQAFNAETLESLWLYEDAIGGQPNCSIRYDDGYVYTGFWSSETNQANWVCISATDEDQTQATEAKTATWTYTVAGGFYWAGAYTNEQYLIVGSDDGTNNHDSESSYVYVLDKYTGKLMQKIGPCVGDIRSDISYYNGRIYFTTKAGYLYSYNLTEEGLIDTENLIEPMKAGAMSTSTPVIYNHRLYIGVTYESNFTGPYGIVVVDIDPETGALTEAYVVETTGYPQTSGALTTAYEEIDGYVYVYFPVNSSTGELYVVKDKAGLTEPDPGSGILFVPNHKQFCICSVVVDKEGTLFFKNDAAYMMVLAKKELLQINVGEQPVAERTANTVSLSLTSNQDGTLYYVVQEAGEKAPDAEFVKKGTVAKVSEGENQITLTGLWEQACTVYMVILNEDMEETEVVAVNVDAYESADKPLAKVEDIFTDITYGKWYYEAVAYAYTNKIMTGMTETEFGPTSTLTRAQVAEILYRLEGRPEVEYKAVFQDVPNGKWYSNSVIWAAQNKIVTGYKNTVFAPNDPITREQMVVMTYRYAQYKDYDITEMAELNQFKDANQVSSYAVTAVKWGVGAGLINGRDPETLLPLGEISRAECAIILKNFMEKYTLSRASRI